MNSLSRVIEVASQEMLKGVKGVTFDLCMKLGNSSELHFGFVWGPPEYIYHLDSTIHVARDTTLFYFTPSAAFQDLDIDSVEILLNRGQLEGHH